jgi:hypothetical protein
MMIGNIVEGSSCGLFWGTDLVSDDGGSMAL